MKWFCYLVLQFCSEFRTYFFVCFFVATTTIFEGLDHITKGGFSWSSWSRHYHYVANMNMSSFCVIFCNKIDHLSLRICYCLMYSNFYCSSLSVNWDFLNIYKKKILMVMLFLNSKIEEWTDEWDWRHTHTHTHIGEKDRQQSLSINSHSSNISHHIPQTHLSFLQVMDPSLTFD